MTTTVLVTGAAGYTGSILCEHLLKSGYRVIAVDNISHRQSSLFHLCHYKSLEFVRGDVRDEYLMDSLLQQVDIIIPLAALVGAPACAADPYAAESINVGSIKLLNRLRSPSQLVIYPNTNSGYGSTSGADWCTEDTPLVPISIYGQTKAEAESILLDSDNTITLRLATVFGMSPRMRLDLLVNYFTYEAVTTGYLVVYEKDFKRNYVHIRDVADCYIHCIENQNKMVGQPYNLGLDEANISKGELAYLIKDLVPEFYIHFAEVGEDPDKRNYLVSNLKLKETGFKAVRGLSTGIEELIKGYQMLGNGSLTNV